VIIYLNVSVPAFRFCMSKKLPLSQQSS